MIKSSMATRVPSACRLLCVCHLLSRRRLCPLSLDERRVTRLTKDPIQGPHSFSCRTKGNPLLLQHPGRREVPSSALWTAANISSRTIRSLSDTQPCRSLGTASKIAFAVLMLIALIVWAVGLRTTSICASSTEMARRSSAITKHGFFCNSARKPWLHRGRQDASCLPMGCRKALDDGLSLATTSDGARTGC